ncbi:MAG: hypothetical protein GY953_58860 [bacterium]|nr:hypothetical protein [bacterium]
MHLKFLLLLITVIPALHSLQGADRAAPLALGETNPMAVFGGHRFDGTWWGQFETIPIIVSFDLQGNFILRRGFDGGGYAAQDISLFSAAQGTWRRTGRRTAAALGARFIFDGDGKLQSAERVRIKMELSKDGKTIEGSTVLEAVFCEDVPGPPPFAETPSCPDLTSVPADVVRGPAAFTLKRLTLDAGTE